MKNQSIKPLSLLAFFALYVTSVYINFAMPQGSTMPVSVNVGVAIALLFSFYFMTIAFSDSKKFLIIVTTYFALVVLSTIMLVVLSNFGGLRWLRSIFLIIHLTCILPFVYFDIKVIVVQNIDISILLILAFLIISFYAVYFITKRIKEKRGL